MSLPLLPSILPPDIQSRIFSMSDNINLAKHSPDFFWAIAPDYLRVLTIGRNFNFRNPRLQTELAEIYPSCGGFVHTLTLLSDAASIPIITSFLENFPVHRQIKHLRLQYSLIRNSFTTAEYLPYHNLLERLVSSSPTLTRLTFSNLQASSSLITLASSITHLDIGEFIPLNEHFFIPLPPQLEILSFSPTTFEYILHPAPPTLRVLIVYTDDIAAPGVMAEIKEFIAQCPSITSLALVDHCKFLFYFILFFKKLIK